MGLWLPLNRTSRTPRNSICLPVAGSPKKLPSWVPDTVKKTAARSVSATTFSTVWVNETKAPVHRR